MSIMSDQTWANSLASENMWQCLLSTPGMLSTRKLRLLACAICRQFWQLMPDQRLRDLVITAERYADGHFKYKGSVLPLVTKALEAINHIADGLVLDPRQEVHLNIARMAEKTVESGLFLRSDAGFGSWFELAYRHQPDILRDLFEPFYQLDRQTHFWHSDEITSMAQAAYDDTWKNGLLDPDRLAILTDALIDAGCPETFSVTRETYFSLLSSADGWYIATGPISKLVLFQHKRRQVVMDWGSKHHKIQWTTHTNTKWKHKKTIRYSGRGLLTESQTHPLLEHLRARQSIIVYGKNAGSEPLPHFKGCWVIDLLRKHQDTAESSPVSETDTKT